MVSGKAGHSARPRRGSCKLSVVPDDRREVPQRAARSSSCGWARTASSSPAAAIPSCTFTLNIPDPEEDAVDIVGDREDDVRRVRLAHEGAPEPHGLDLPRLHGVPEVPQRHQHRGRGRQGRGAGPTSRPGRCARAAAAPWCAATAASARTSPARTTRPASSSRPSRSRTRACAVPRTAASSPSGAGRFRPVLRLRQLPELRLLALGAPDSGDLPAVRQPVPALPRAQGGNVFACDKAGCGFEKPPGELPPIVEFTPEAPPEEPVAVVAAAKKAKAPRAGRRRRRQGPAPEGEEGLIA